MKILTRNGWVIPRFRLLEPRQDPLDLAKWSQRELLLIFNFQQGSQHKD